MLASSLLKTGARLAALALFGALVATGSAKGGRDYISGNFSLELDGVNVGVLTDVLSSTREVKGSTPTLDQTYVKSVTSGPITWQEIKFHCHIGMGRTLYDWIAAETNGDYTRHNGAIVLSDALQRPTTRLEFTNAVWAVVSFSGTNVLSQDPGDMTLTLSVSSTKVVKAQATYGHPPTLNAGDWTLRQFQFTIPNFDTGQVRDITSITLYGRVIDMAKNNLVDVPPTPDPIISPTMHVQLSAMPAGQVAAGPFGIWFTATQGKAFTGAKTGTLKYVGADGRAFFTLTFPAIGISSLEALAKQDLHDLKVKYHADLPFTPPTFSYSLLAVGH